MLVTNTLAILVTSGLCLAIRVPVTWEQNEPNSEVNNDNENFSVENIQHEISTQKIPVEYFEYTAKKPQFAADIAAFHGVKSPENHYKAYPIEPYTGSQKPALGRHKVVNEELYRPIKEYGEISEHSHEVAPVPSSYEVFHPYQAEVPALQEIYRDPVMTKIRNDLENSKLRLQNYENEAGKPNIAKDEYLESPQQTDGKLFPQRHVPAPYEIHRPQRRPIYYRPTPKYHHRDEYLNHRLRHPWNQYVKVKPMHYRPLKNHIHHLRQNHALKYDDERNEYPQVVLENYSEPKDGYDIYERGREKFVKLRNNVDESINKAVKENRPTTYERLEIQNNDSSSSSENSEEDKDEEEFVPIKNYAQVRRTETFKHLPKSAAFEDAETYDEIRNAPRLREAVKSTKAQTVYSEEGYEDAAYDHAGEQKHASENEGHGGFLKQHELSNGKYKTPSFSGSHDDASGSIYKDKLVHNKKWKDDNLDHKDETEEEDYSEVEHEHALEEDNYQDTSKEEENPRSKRENNETSVNSESSTANISLSAHDLDKREVNFEVPELDLNSTFLTEKDIKKIAKIKLIPKKEHIKHKYPYYFKDLKSISKHSPLRYAENLKFIPKKTKGGTEFYDSRSKFECPEVEDVPDPIPEKLRDGNNPDEVDEVNKGEENFDTTKKQPRLGGLGDKIDCFKAKYFGENPLDSPFFKEELIQSPEPITAPNLATYKFKLPALEKELEVAESKINQTKARFKSETDLYTLISKLRNENNTGDKLIEISAMNLSLPVSQLHVILKNTKPTTQTNIYTDVIGNIKNNLTIPTDKKENLSQMTQNEYTKMTTDGVTYNFYKNKDDVTTLQPVLRKKRATTPFIYEPYKIIRDSQVQDSKKTTTTSNISPLIKQLQSSRVVDRVAQSTKDTENTTKQVKRNVHSRTYKDIGKKEREQSKNDKPTITSSEIVDVNVDKRRGEPKYEIRLSNHKQRYTPVDNKKAMSVEDYKTQIRNVTKGSTVSIQRKKPTDKPFFDVSKYIPQISDIQNAAASNTVRKTVRTTTTSPAPDKHTQDEDYDEYYDDENEEEVTTTTTKSPKPSFRRRIRVTTEKVTSSTEKPILQLVTRFRDYKHETTPDIKPEHADKPQSRNINANEDHIEPKYTEKKKKSTKSTVVTDTKKYGDENDQEDMRKEVDALIGVKQDNDDYIPSYEKKASKKTQKPNEDSSEVNDDDEEEEEDEDHDDGEDHEEDDDHDDNDDDNEDHDDDDDNDDDYDDDEISDEDDENDDSEEDKTNIKDQNVEQKLSTTTEPTKRSLVITTEAPKPTIASRSEKIQIKPIITKKKIEIHKEIPVNNSSPHVTQFKQDIKEVEIVKEMPLRRRIKPNKNVEALELYKDDKLAEEVNKLGAVEVFKENLDLKTGPKHGGNYKRFSGNPGLTREQNTKGDAEASQTEFKKQVNEDKSEPRLLGGYLKIRGPESKRRDRSEFAEKSTPNSEDTNNSRKARPTKSEKLIELEEESEEEDLDDSKDERYTRKHVPMHGGNYRSAPLKVDDNNDKELSKIDYAKEGRKKAVLLLNTFAKAVPVLTSTPSYILDPSKRMYYYVDA